eukprot:403345136
MERTAPSTARSSTQEVISQNLTVEQLRNKRMAANSKVRLGTSIASGAFGTVYSALLTREIKEYIAMKVIKRENRGQIQELDQYNLIEIEIMSQIDNPYINKLIDYYFQVDQKTKQEELVLLSPLAMYDLNKFLENNYPKGRMPESMAIEFLAQLAFGTKAMHDKKVIHRDLNPRNILVFKNEQKSALNNQEFILKISDFGCSKILGIDQSRALTQQVGKINYMAPEQLNNSVQGYNASVDVYGLGLTIFQMISGKVFNAADITSRNFKDQYSSSFIDLLYKLCSLDYKQRPSVDQLIEHPIVQKSQTFINCLLQGILPMTTSKIISTIGCLQNLQKQHEAQEKLIDDLQQKFPPHILQERLQKPFKHSIPEIGRIFYQMNRVRSQYKDQDFEWQTQYEMAFGNNDKQYFISKYLGESSLQNDEKLRILNGCSFKRQVDANGNIFIGFYKDDRSRKVIQVMVYFMVIQVNMQQQMVITGTMMVVKLMVILMDMEYRQVVMVLCIVVNIRMARHMDQAHFIGMMEASMKDIG